MGHPMIIRNELSLGLRYSIPIKCLKPPTSPHLTAAYKTRNINHYVLPNVDKVSQGSRHGSVYHSYKTIKKCKVFFSFSIKHRDTINKIPSATQYNCPRPRWCGSGFSVLLTLTTKNNGPCLKRTNYSSSFAWNTYIKVRMSLNNHLSNWTLIQIIIINSL